MSVTYNSVKPGGRLRCSRRSGQAMVEMALLSLLFITLVLGFVQYAILTNVSNTVSHLAREGARFAAVHATGPSVDPGATDKNGTDEDIITYVVAQSQQSSVPLTTQYPNVTGTDTITITPAEGSASRVVSGEITVTITRNVHPLQFLPFNLPGQGPGTYQAAATEVIEQ